MLVSSNMDSARHRPLIERFGQNAVVATESGAPSTAAHTARDELTFTPAGAEVAPWLLGFAYRYDAHCGHVVYELPELRPTIQIMLADDYYLRERDDTGSWKPAPRVALWGPRVTWGYGYARKVVRAFGIGLTPRGFEDLVDQPIAAFTDRVVDLADVRPDIASELAAIVAKGAAAEWICETTALVLRLVNASLRGANELDRSLPHLIQDQGDAVKRASQAAGVGDRQYRRLFQSRYGFSPRLYRRVLRIDRLMRRLHPAPWESDGHAPDLNFADQAHMIREFKALTGVTPGEYVRSKCAHGDATIRSVIAKNVAPPSL
jgi:AraC-like DNA-binding protein